MQITLNWNADQFLVDLSNPKDISIPLKNEAENQPNAYHAPRYEASPVRAGNFIGSLEAGAPVNFFNIHLNPHGNGTHTECVGHILQGPWYLRECFKQSHFVAELLTVTPDETPNGYRVTQRQLQTLSMYAAEALIVRTLPNPESKMHRNYSGTNPPCFEEEAMQWLVGRNYRHLLTDLPSVDPEEDGGALAAHRTFWNLPGEVRSDCTITELIYVPANIPDGLYLLDLHTAAFHLDVSPSRPMLYEMTKRI
jgi:kynurenine formamidase